jgi:hypothetical protein
VIIEREMDRHMWRIPHMPGRASRHHKALEACLPPEPFATSDQVLLCCFGLDQSTERSGTQLRNALVEVGFASPAAREIIRRSPLVHRSSTGSYHLRRLCMERSVP